MLSRSRLHTVLALASAETPMDWPNLADFRVIRAVSLESALQTLGKTPVDLILVRVPFSGCPQKDLFEQLAAASHGAAFVIYDPAGHASVEETGVAVLEHILDE